MPNSERQTFSPHLLPFKTPYIHLYYICNTYAKLINFACTFSIGLVKLFYFFVTHKLDFHHLHV